MKENGRAAAAVKKKKGIQRACWKPTRKRRKKKESTRTTSTMEANKSETTSIFPIYPSIYIYKSEKKKKRRHEPDNVVNVPGTKGRKKKCQHRFCEKTNLFLFSPHQLWGQFPLRFFLFFFSSRKKCVSNLVSGGRKSLRITFSWGSLREKSTMRAISAG